MTTQQGKRTLHLPKKAVSPQRLDDLAAAMREKFSTSNKVRDKQGASCDKKQQGR